METNYVSGFAKSRELLRPTRFIQMS
jgi:hypothetical protein